MTYEFEVPGKIIGKGRPRLNTYTGSVYTPTKTKDYECLIQQYFLLKYPCHTPFEGRVFVEIKAFFGIPKSAKKAERESMLENRINPTKKPDIDNIVKVILDAMNGVAFGDDTQITKLCVEKVYDEEERVLVRISEY